MAHAHRRAARTYAVGVHDGADGGARGADRLSGSSPPPYPGLASFGDGDDDADLFYGRTRERDLLIANLRAARLTVLYGSSGVGKSSLLHAGVIHRLRTLAAEQDAAEDDGEPRTGVVIVDDWTGDPAARLAAQIRALTSDDSSGSVADAVAAYRRRSRGGLLVIFDQFEDYLRLHPNAQLETLLPALSASARVLIAIREDRLADLDRFSGRVPGLLGNMLRLGHLSPTAALEAIEGPIDRCARWASAGRVGRPVALEDELAETVRDQLVSLSERRRPPPATTNGGARHGGVVEAAYLQLVMRRLFDEDITAAGGTLLRNATLARLGGAEEIVATHLDTALGSLSSREQAVADELLRFLVTPSGATACLTARDLSEYANRPQAEVEALADKLSRPPARILRGVAAPSGQLAAGGYELPPILTEPALEWRARRRTGRLERRARNLLLGLVAVTAVAVTLVGYALDPAPLRRLELSSVHWRFDVRGQLPPDPRIALVTLDDAANARVAAGREAPRAVTARALDAIASAHPRAVAVDIVYDARRDPLADDRLIAAIHGPLSARLVLAADRLNSDGMSQLFGRPSQVFTDSGTPAVGYAGFPADSDRVVRRVERSVAVSPGAAGLDTLGVVAARLGGAIDARRLPGAAWIDFRGPSGTFKPIAFLDVLHRQPAALAKLRGKIVLLGNTAAAANDAYLTSAPGSGRMAGAEIQANAISTALDRFPLRDGGRGLDLALIIGLGLLPLAAAMRLRPSLVVLAAAVAAALFCAAAQVAFDAGHVISIVYPLGGLVLTTVGLGTAARVRRRGSGAPADAVGVAHARAA